MREKKYRIREMADILGVSTDTLRFYEKKQVMKPEKGENGYRYYTKEDIRNFLWIIYSRKLGFGLEEIVELRNEGGEDVLDQFKAHVLSQMEKERAVIEEHERIIKRLLLTVQDIDSIKTHMGKYSIAAFPAARILSSFPDQHQAIKEWYEIAKQYPGLDMAYLHSSYSLKGEDTCPFKVDLLLYEEAEQEAKLPEAFKECIQMEQTPCVYTVVRKENDEVTREDFRKMEEWAFQNGYEPQPWGWSNVPIFRDGTERPFYYIGLYLPINER